MDLQYQCDASSLRAERGQETKAPGPGLGGRGGGRPGQMPNGSAMEGLRGMALDRAVGLRAGHAAPLCLGFPPVQRGSPQDLLGGCDHRGGGAGKALHPRPRLSGKHFLCSGRGR